MTMPKGYANNNNTHTISNKLPLSRKQKKLLQQKVSLETSLNDTTIQIQREAEREKTSTRKQNKLLQQKTNLEASLQATWIQIQREERKQQDKYLKKYEPTRYKENKELQKVIAKEQYKQRIRLERQNKIPREGKRTAYKILIGLGIFITIISFFGSSAGGGILGFIINIIGVALVTSGNRDRGAGTTIIGGGFVSFGGGTTAGEQTSTDSSSSSDG